MTLIELIVAMTALTFVVGGVVAFMTFFLGAWSDGEASREISDRQQLLAHQFREDLCRVFVEADPPAVGSPVRFLCGPDPNGNPMLRFVVAGESSAPAAPASGGAGQGGAVPFPYYAQLYEVAYVLDTSRGKANLWRGMRDFTRGSQTFFDDRYLASPAVRGQFSLLDDRVLHVEYRFWTKYSNTWDVAIPPAATPAGSKVVVKGKTMVGPSSIWDSARTMKGFFLESIRGDMRSSEPVFPSAIQVIIEREKEGGDTRLGRDCGSEDSTLAIENGDALPPAPAFCRIDDEWIEYAKKGSGEIASPRRGARGTKQSKHTAGTPVRFGERIVLEISIPAYRHQEE